MNRKKKRSTASISQRLLCALILLLLGACGGGRTVDQTIAIPTLDLFAFFEGHTQAWGVVQDWRGRVVRQFVVHIEGIVDHDKLTLEEVFDYADGERDFRRWKIRRDSSGGISGTANDIIGAAVGEINGNSLIWRYEMELESEGRRYLVTFDDRLWQVDDDTLINRTYIKKFGLTVAEVSLFMRRSGDYQP